MAEQTPFGVNVTGHPTDVKGAVKPPTAAEIKSLKEEMYQDFLTAKSGGEIALDYPFDKWVRRSLATLEGLRKADIETEYNMGRIGRAEYETLNEFRIKMIESIKNDEVTTPMFDLVDFPATPGMDESAVIEDLRARGFGLDEDKQQRMVTEFFTGVMPDVCYAIFKDKWQRRFDVSAEQLEAMYRKAIDETHSEHHRST